MRRDRAPGLEVSDDRPSNRRRTVAVPTCRRCNPLLGQLPSWAARPRYPPTTKTEKTSPSSPAARAASASDFPLAHSVPDFDQLFARANGTYTRIADTARFWCNFAVTADRMRQSDAATPLASKPPAGSPTRTCLVRRQEAADGPIVTFCSSLD